MLSLLHSPGPGLGRLEQLGQVSDWGWGCLVTSLFMFGPGCRMTEGSAHCVCWTEHLHMTSLSAWDFSQHGTFSVARVLAWPLGATNANVACVSKVVDQVKQLYIADRSGLWGNHCVKTFWQFLIKLYITIWINLKNYYFNERSQIKDYICTIPVMW